VAFQLVDGRLASGVVVEEGYAAPGFFLDMVKLVW
jgi:hypothetical protein